MLTDSKIITLQELSKILNISRDTLRTWLQGYRFTKFFYRNYVTFNKDFVMNMSEYLKLKRRHGLAKYLTDFYKKNSCR